MTDFSANRRDFLRTAVPVGLASGLLSKPVVAQGEAPPGQGIIEGIVTDTGENPLSDIEVNCTSTSGTFEQTDTTDSDGKYLFDLEPENDYEISVDEQGYEKFVHEQGVASGEYWTIDIELTPVLSAQNGLAIDNNVAYIISASQDGEIQQVDIEERTVIKTFDAPGGSRARGLAYGDESLWFADGVEPDYDGEIVELNPDTGSVRSRIETLYDPRGLAFGDGSLWAIDITYNIIHEYLPDGTREGGFGIRGPTGVTYGRGLAYFDGSLWVGEFAGSDGSSTASLYEFTTDGEFLQETGERTFPDGEGGGYGGLATTSTELLGPDEDGNLTVLRTLGEGDDPEINATSIDIDPYPVEKGDSPEIRIIVEGADEVNAILEKTDRSGAPSTVTLDMEQEAEDQWAATDHSVSFDELGWWDLRIEAQSGTGESVTLDTFEIDDPRDPDEQEGEWLLEDQELGFHVFEEVADVAVVVGWFADEDPPTDSEVAELSAWFEARERDTNYYFGSNRGMRSLVGFNMELRLFESGEIFGVKEREHYENEDPGNGVFMQDLKSIAFPSNTLEDYDFWIGTHPGKQVDTGSESTKGNHNTELEGLYAPIRSRTPTEVKDSEQYSQYVYSYNILNHEIGHAFGFGHPDAIGNQGGLNESHMCVMTRSSNRLPPENRSPEDEINPVPPVSTIHYLTKELEFSIDVRNEIPWWLLDTTEGLLTTSNQLDYKREDWLRLSKTELIDINQEYTDPKFVAGVRSYNTGDQVPAVTANTGVFDQTVKYIFESRPLVESNERGDVDWSNDTGTLVIYKWEQREAIYEAEKPETEDLQPSYNVLENEAGERAIRNPGEEIRDELDDGRVVVFQLHNKEWKNGIGNPAGFHTEVKIKKEPGNSDTQTVTLDDPTSIPAGLDPSCFAEYTSPSLDLKAIDSEGRVVGINHDGEYVNQIPGAKASGKRVQGTEWISVPEDVDVDFRVSSADVDRFIEDMEQLGTLADEADESDNSISKSELENRLTREYGVSQATYGDNPELVEDDGETVVTDTTTRVQRKEIEPGEEKEATPRNPFSDVDIVAIYPDTESLAEERVVLTNRGTETLDATGWQIMNEGESIFVMPEFELNPGQEVAIRTGNGEDTDTDLYRDAEQSQWNPDGGQVQLIDNTGTTILSVTYDDRGVIEYDDTREDDGEPSLADYAGSDDLIHLVGLRDAIDDWRDNIIGD